MKTSKFDAWIKRILATEDEEISCSDCFDLLSEYVDMEITHGPVRENHLKVEQHLIQCQVCREEYEILHSLAQMDAEEVVSPQDE